MDVAFRIVDVFTDRPFAGNQLCVVPDPPPGLSTELMHTLTREIAFSETTFVTAIRPAGYDVRIFTPAAELPFAGHPTLGTAFVLAAEGRVDPTLIQRCGAGDIPVEVDLQGARASMRQRPPVVGPPVADRALVAAGAGLSEHDLADLPLLPVSTGVAHLMVPVSDVATLRRAERQPAPCERACIAAETESLYLFAVVGTGHVVARMFDRSTSIGEDPATGSAAGPLGAYLALHGLAGMPGRVTVDQGEMVGRPSHLDVAVERDGGSWAIQVAGGVRIVGEGVFHLDD
jgi:trans-2,3-dihydro-3-hydroxyanthranilate isomerase